MVRRIAIVMIAAAVLGLVGSFFLACRPAIAPIAPPTPASFPAESIAKGATLAAAGHCVSCHTRPGGQPFAGGYGLNTPFGIIYGTNITPDPETGIWRWSLVLARRCSTQFVGNFNKWLDFFSGAGSLSAPAAQAIARAHSRDDIGMPLEHFGSRLEEREFV